MMNNNIIEIKRKIRPTLERHGVKKAAVFGSFARGEESRESDVDILIEFQQSNDKSLLDLVALKLDLEDILEKKVDVVEYSTIKPLLRKNILKEQVLVL